MDLICILSFNSLNTLFVDFIKFGLTIYVACESNGLVIMDENIAQRAEEKLGERKSYNLLFDNCHQFTYGCITGDFKNSNSFFSWLEETLEDRYNNGEKLKWRCMEFSVD